MKKEVPVKGILLVIIKDSLITCFFHLTDLKSNCIRQYVYNCTVGPITYRNVMYLTIVAQKSFVKTKPYWNKKMTPDGNSKAMRRN